MLSLYIHVPFCDKKCGYCSFFVVPKEGMDPQAKLIEGYIEGLIRDIKFWGTHYKKPELKTLYFGGGTPGILGKKVLMQIIDTIAQYFDLTYLEELSIELNPNPYDEIIDLVKTLNHTYKDFPRIRYSFGIQSFDDGILHASSRQYSFVGIQKFLRELRTIKEGFNVFNLDFISFGKGTWMKTNSQNGTVEQYLFRDRERREWFETLANSGFVDSYSLYTLELFAGSQWEKTKRKEIDGISHLDLSQVPFETDQEKITTEFQRLKESILDAGYKRYELSNFSQQGKQSIHNTIYRTMGSYLGLGPSAASFLTGKYAENLPTFLNSQSTGHKAQGNKEELVAMDQQLATSDNVGPMTYDPGVHQGVRFTESTSIFGYTKESKLDPQSIIFLTEKEYMIEKLFLALRTSRGVDTLSSYTTVLVPNRQALVAQYDEAGLLIYEDDRLILTDEGLDVYNTMVSELLVL